MHDYEDLGHMSIAHNDDASTGYYLPHHGVLRTTNDSRKLRVVFNDSKATSNGKSLNDCLLAGPALQNDLSAIVMRARRHKFIFTADVRHMFRQILILPAHQSYQKILWTHQLTDFPDTYYLRTVTYGTRCAPYLSL